MSWFIIRKADNRVLGWTRSAGATPADTAELNYVSQNFEAGMTLYNQLENEMLAEGRNVEIYLSGGTLVKATDDRPFGTIVADKTVVDADGVDFVTLTFTRQDNPTFSGQVRLEIGGKYLKLDFVDGIAVKPVRSRQSGVLSFESNPRYRVIDPLSIEFVE